MSVSGRSFQDAVRRRQQAGFVGRMAELAQFRANLTLPVDDPDRRFIFGVHGDGGVGKSYLLRQWVGIAEGVGAITCSVDEPVFGVPEAMRAIAADLARQGTDTESFLKLLDGYEQRRFEAEADPDAPSGLAAFMTQTAVRIGLHAAHAVPGVGGLADSVDANALAVQADQLRVFLGKKFRRHEDVRLLLSPLDVLTPVLVSNLVQAGRRRVLALFFDTYEQTGLVLDGWFKSVLDGVYGSLPENLVITVAGRSPLDGDGWAPYLSVIADVPLEPFTDTEAHQFLAERGIKDDRVIKVILTVSGRLPLLLAMLAENQPTNPELVGDRSGDAVERFLKWERDPSRRALALAAALPRVVNEDVLAVLLATDSREEQGRLFAWLRSLPFTTDNAGRCQYHEVVRTAMIRLERRQSPVRWKERHRDLAAAYHAWRVDQTPQDAWDDPAWLALRLEETYHLLCTDPGTTLALGLGELVQVCANQPAIAAQWAQAITQAGQDAGAESLRVVGRRLEQSLRLNPEEATVACLQILLSEGRLPEDYLPLALHTRGRTLYYLDREEEALVDLNKAVALTPDDPASLADRGEVYRWLGRYEEALADLDRAIDLDPDSMWAIGGRGQTYRSLERYEEALADFDRAIELDPDYTWTVANRGETYRLMGRYEEALADFDRAIELEPDYQWAIGSRGQTYRHMGRCEEALADLGRAIELDPSATWTIANRGETYRLMGRYEEALTDFDHAINLDAADDWHRYLSSLVYLSRRQTSEATSNLEAAIDLAQANVQMKGKYSNDAYNIGVYLAANRAFKEAREQFTKALQNCFNPWWALEAISDLRDLKKIQGTAASELDALVKHLEEGRSSGPR